MELKPRLEGKDDGPLAPTLRDVATLAGVSTATVSHVINGTRRTTAETRARVERAITQLDFVPNAAGRALAMRKGLGESNAASPNAALRQSDGSVVIRAFAARRSGDDAAAGELASIFAASVTQAGETSGAGLGGALEVAADEFLSHALNRTQMR